MPILAFCAADQAQMFKNKPRLLLMMWIKAAVKH